MKLKIQIIYQVHYLFPREDRTYRPFALRYFSDSLYEARQQDFTDKNDAKEFLALTRLHFQKILPSCSTSLNRKNFCIKWKVRFVKGEKNVKKR